MQAALKSSLPLKHTLSRVSCRRQTLDILFSSRISVLSFKTRITRSTQLKFKFLGASRPFSFTSSRRGPPPEPVPQRKEGSEDLEGSSVVNKPALRENIYTIPNILTVSRIVACPALGWAILGGNYHLATGLLVYAGLTDLCHPCHLHNPWVSFGLKIDGHLARKYNMGSVLGSILDPAADKLLMTTLTVTLTMQDMIPLPLAVVILGRDVLLSLSAFYIRYSTLPPPRFQAVTFSLQKTWSRYWDMGLPSAEVRPTMVSKVNTALQLLLMGVTTTSPLLPIDLDLALQGLQWTVATTTIWSGMQYLFSKDAVRIISKNRIKP
ncbi:hypothetical protein FA13DRAFT_1705905 [Coprinellus micaceus]|uniref:CDP-alcohol phosphatidyltransferase n=1 Tax=Coprinellus micaceus TaxID=71717 RepID=A0A4Y7TQY1_COPMI|nr:hypothetical protein FA13DRAFT_1705905 [Coprinellus micaceus]